MWCMPFSTWGSTPGHICAGIEQNCITSVLLALCMCLKQQFQFVILLIAGAEKLNKQERKEQDVSETKVQ